MNKPIPSISIDTQALINHLMPERIPVGKVISYDELSGVIGRDVRSEGYPNLASARRWLLNNKQVLYEVVRGVGIKRCNDIEKVEAGAAEIPRIRRKARKAARKVASVGAEGYAALPRDKQIQHNAVLAQLGSVALFSSTSATKKIVSKVEQEQKRLTVHKTLELFSK